MKKPMRPFAVELRRTGKKPVSLPAKHMSDPIIIEPEHAEKLVPEAWFKRDEAPVSEAQRAANAFFKSPSPSVPPAETELGLLDPPTQADARRVLPSLDEPDYIARMLQEEEARRPKRGRKPGAGLAPVRRIVTKEKERKPEPAAPLIILKSVPKTIKGYVRGRIYARYVRKTEPGFGHYWRKRPTPAW